MIEYRLDSIDSMLEQYELMDEFFEELDDPYKEKYHILWLESDYSLVKDTMAIAALIDQNNKDKQ